MLQKSAEKGERVNLAQSLKELGRSQRSVGSKAPNKKEEGVRILIRILKRKLQRTFDQLQMGAIDYKRQLVFKRQRE